MHIHARNLYFLQEIQRFSLIRQCRRPFSSATVDDADKGKDFDIGKGTDLPMQKNPYPYPKHPNPTPHQIFHLPPSATQAQIKARYYELVRAHHPDSYHAARIGAELAHVRFRTIKAAYDFLAGKTLSPHPNARPAPSPQNFDPYMHELARRRRAYYASQGRYQEDGEPMSGYTRRQYPDDGYNESGRKERIILAFGVLALLAGLFPTLPGTLMSVVADTSTTTSSKPSPSSPRASSSSASVPISPAVAPAAGATPAGGVAFPFIDLDKVHREAVSALVQVRSEREVVGAERREGVRRRVKEMHGIAESSEVACNRPGSSQTSGSEPMSAPCQGVSVNIVEDVNVPELRKLRIVASHPDQKTKADATDEQV